MLGYEYLSFVLLAIYMHCKFVALGVMVLGVFSLWNLLFFNFWSFYYWTYTAQFYCFRYFWLSGEVFGAFSCTLFWFWILGVCLLLSLESFFYFVIFYYHGYHVWDLIYFRIYSCPPSIVVSVVI